MERWKPIPGHPNYEASDLGRIRSVERWTVHNKCGTPMRLKGKILKAHPQTTGHLGVSLPPHHTYRVHRLVALAWLGPPPFEGAMARHWDDDTTNNNLSNLRWGTQTNNMDDAKRNGQILGGLRPRGSRQVSPGVFR